ncbi:MAG: SMC-Scp complex subunit ScpB [Kiritimatiellae bacterium]|nr:SMC-Scp complex subunit ScpB [Kiritimatiellia bacterium]
MKMPLPGSLQEIVGSLLFASQTPLSVADIRESVRAVECEEGERADVMEVYRTCTSKEVESALRGLEKALEVAQAGFELVCTAGTYRLQTVPSCGRYVRAMLKLDRPSRLGRASLETLAIIAYRQPITKSEIESIRGVDVSANIKTLMDLQLIRIVGKSELPGHPFLYGTTAIFLEHFGLSNLQQLNELDPTLQRSNPRLKAASYKKVEKTELEKAAEEDAEAGGEASKEGGGETAGLAADGAEGSDDEDFEIDDTPDEFDEEDDDDEDDDEDAGGDGADGDPDDLL